MLVKCFCAKVLQLLNIKRNQLVTSIENIVNPITITYAFNNTVINNVIVNINKTGWENDIVSIKSNFTDQNTLAIAGVYAFWSNQFVYMRRLPTLVITKKDYIINDLMSFTGNNILIESNARILNLPYPNGATDALFYMESVNKNNKPRNVINVLGWTYLFKNNIRYGIKLSLDGYRIASSILGTGATINFYGLHFYDTMDSIKSLYHTLPDSGFEGYENPIEDFYTDYIKLHWSGGIKSVAFRNWMIENNLEPLRTKTAALKNIVNPTILKDVYSPYQIIVLAMVIQKYSENGTMRFDEIVNNVYKNLILTGYRKDVEALYSGFISTGSVSSSSSKGIPSFKRLDDDDMKLLEGLREDLLLYTQAMTYPNSIKMSKKIAISGYYNNFQQITIRYLRDISMIGKNNVALLNRYNRYISNVKISITKYGIKKYA